MNCGYNVSGMAKSRSTMQCTLKASFNPAETFFFFFLVVSVSQSTGEKDDADVPFSKRLLKRGGPVSDKKKNSASALISLDFFERGFLLGSNCSLFEKKKKGF
jgi:hypothetical protein